MLKLFYKAEFEETIHKKNGKGFKRLDRLEFEVICQIHEDESFSLIFVGLPNRWKYLQKGINSINFYSNPRDKNNREISYGIMKIVMEKDKSMTFTVKDLASKEIIYDSPSKPPIRKLSERVRTKVETFTRFQLTEDENLVELKSVSEPEEFILKPFDITTEFEKVLAKDPSSL